VGTYEGDRSVTLRDGHLYYRRAPIASSELTALASGGYSFDGEARIRFAEGAPAPALTIERSDGTTARFARVTNQ
jgi:hypothetical protein